MVDKCKWMPYSEDSFDKNLSNFLDKMKRYMHPEHPYEKPLGLEVEEEAVKKMFEIVKCQEKLAINNQKASCIHLGSPVKHQPVEDEDDSSDSDGNDSRSWSPGRKREKEGELTKGTIIKYYAVGAVHGNHRSLKMQTIQGIGPDGQVSVDDPLFVGTLKKKHPVAISPFETFRPIDSYNYEVDAGQTLVGLQRRVQSLKAVQKDVQKEAQETFFKNTAKLRELQKELETRGNQTTLNNINTQNHNHNGLQNEENTSKNDVSTNRNKSLLQS